MAKPLVSTDIDVTREFPALGNAPVVEAVVEWRAEPSVTMKSAELRPILEQLFPGCAIQPLRHVHATIAEGESGVQLAEATEQTGFRIVSEDGRIVGQIRSNCVAVSRLEPYAGWDEFLPRAKPFVQVFLEHFKPTHFSRLGVRSISRITVPTGEVVRDVTKGTATPWKDFGMESTSFFHQDTVRWPGTAYGVRLVRAMDPGEPGEVGILLLDIDISLVEAVELVDADRRIAEMRFLKNRVFFSTVRSPKHRFGARR
jgi:uncharacterized protein (TIGR04255 family)